MTSPNTAASNGANRSRSPRIVPWIGWGLVLAALGLPPQAQAAEPLPFPLKLDASVFASQADFQSFLKDYDYRDRVPAATLAVQIPWESPTARFRPVTWVSASKGLVVGTRKDEGIDWGSPSAPRVPRHMKLLLVDFVTGAVTTVMDVDYEWKGGPIRYNPLLNQGYLFDQVSVTSEIGQRFHLEGETVIFDAEEPDTPCALKRRELAASEPYPRDPVFKPSFATCITPDVFIYKRPEAAKSGGHRLRVPGKPDEPVSGEVAISLQYDGYLYEDYLKSFPVTQWVPVTGGLMRSYIGADGSIVNRRIPVAGIVPFKAEKGWFAAHGAVLRDGTNSVLPVLLEKEQRDVLWFVTAAQPYLIRASNTMEFRNEQVSPDGCLLTYTQRALPERYTSTAYRRPFELKVLNLCTGVFK